MPPAPSARPAWVALALLSLIWAYNWIMLKEGLRFADPFDFAALRTAPSALLLIGASLGLLSWLTMRGERGVEPVMGQE